MLRKLANKIKDIADVALSTPGYGGTLGEYSPASTSSWLLTIRLNGQAEGLDEGYAIAAFDKPSHAELAAMQANGHCKVIYDTYHDDLIQRLADREAKIVASQQWRFLCEQYPDYFGEYGTAHLHARSLRFGVTFGVQKVPRR